MRVTIARLALLCAALTFTGCERPRVAWQLTATPSMVDGDVLSATWLFTSATNPTTVQAELICRRRASKLLLRLVSREATANNGEYAPSPIDAESGDLRRPIGRVVRTAWTGAREELTLAEAFVRTSEPHVLQHDVAPESAARWLLHDEEAFWRWAVMATPNPDWRDADELEEVLRLSRADLVMTELVGHAEVAQKLGELGSGGYLRYLLPMTVELQNSGGTFALTVPHDDPSVNTVLDACAGTPWWTR